MAPKLSIIVPNYNHARYLRQRLESIFVQNYPNAELIILDDKSTDDSLDIINKVVSEHPDWDIKIITNDVNSGSPFKQWGKGILASKGEYVWIAESDDWAADDFLVQVMGQIDKHNLDLCFTQSMIVYDDGRELEPLCKGYFSDVDRIFTFDDMKDEMARQNIVPNASAVVFRRALALPLLNKISKYRMSGDWVFWMLLLNSGNRYGYIGTALNYYRHLEESASKKNKKRFAHISETFTVFAEFKRNGLPYNYKFWVDKWLQQTGYNINALFHNNFWPNFKALAKLGPKPIGYFMKSLLWHK